MKTFLYYLSRFFTGAFLVGVGLWLFFFGSQSWFAVYTAFCFSSFAITKLRESVKQKVFAARSKAFKAGFDRGLETSYENGYADGWDEGLSVGQLEAMSNQDHRRTRRMKLFIAGQMGENLN